MRSQFREVVPVFKSIVIEEAKFDTLGNAGKQRKVRSVVIAGGTERKGLTGLRNHARLKSRLQTGGGNSVMFLWHPGNLSVVPVKPRNPDGCRADRPGRLGCYQSGGILN